MGRGRRSPERYAGSLGPSEALDGAAARLVFAADPALVAAGVDLLQQPAVVQVAFVRLAAIGRVGDLVVASEGRVLLDGDGDVAILDLAVVEGELQAQIRLPPLLD